MTEIKPKMACPKCLKSFRWRKGPVRLTEAHKARRKYEKCSGGGQQLLSLSAEELHALRWPPLCRVGDRYRVPTTTVEVTFSTRSRVTVRDLHPVGKATWEFGRKRWLKMRPTLIQSQD